MSKLSDKELPGYCTIHCRTERALFHSDHINRMIELAGFPKQYVSKVPEGWHTIYADAMDPLVELVEKNMSLIK